jgi:hypothetical protein
MEKWITIKGFNGYECSNLGNLRSLNYKRTGKIQILKPAISKDGYLKTMLKNNDGKYCTIAVHRVILNSYIAKPSNQYEVNHINGIKTDNSINNLEWLTHSQNCKHSFDIGLQKPKKGALNGMAKLTQKDVNYLREKKNSGGRFWGRNEYAKQFNISPKHLQKLVNTKENWN